MRSQLTWTPSTARLAIASSSAIGGTAFFSSLLVMESCGPMFFVMFRMIATGLIILTFGRLVGKRVTSELFFAAFLPGVIYGVGLVFVFSGLRSGNTSLGAFLSNIETLFIPIVNFLLFKKRTSISHLILILIGALGLALLTLKADFTIDVSLYWFICASVLFALTVCSISESVRKHDSLLFTGCQIFISGSTAGIGFLLFEDAPTAFPLSFWLIMLYFIVLVSILRFPLQNHAMKFIPTSEVGLMYLVEPLTAAMIGVFILNEQLTLRQWMGAAIVFVAVSLVFQSKAENPVVSG